MINFFLRANSFKSFLVKMTSYLFKEYLAAKNGNILISYRIVISTESGK